MSGHMPEMQKYGLATAASRTSRTSDQSTAIIDYLYNYITPEAAGSTGGPLDVSWLALTTRTSYFVTHESLHAFLADPTTTSIILAGLVGTSIVVTNLPTTSDKSPRPTNDELGGAKMSPGVWEFCAKHDSLHLAQGIDLARKHFSLTSICVCVEEDPEVDDASYLVIKIQVTGSVTENVMSHRRFASEAAKLLGTSREFIRLHCDAL